MRQHTNPWAEVSNLARQRSFRVSAVVLSSVAVVTWGAIAVNALTGQPSDPAPRPTVTASAPAKPAPTKPKPAPSPTAKAPPSTKVAPKPPATWTPNKATPAPKPKTVTVKPKPAPKPAPKPKTLAPKPKPTPVVSYPRPAGPPYSIPQMQTALMRAGMTANQAAYFAQIGYRETGGWNFPTTNWTGRYHGPWAFQEASNPGLDYRRLDCDLDYAARQTVALYRRAGLRPWATAY